MHTIHDYTIRMHTLYSKYTCTYSVHDTHVYPIRQPYTMPVGKILLGNADAHMHCSTYNSVAFIHSICNHEPTLSIHTHSNSYSHKKPSVQHAHNVCRYATYYVPNSATVLLNSCSVYESKPCPYSHSRQRVLPIHTESRVQHTVNQLCTPFSAHPSN